MRFILFLATLFLLCQAVVGRRRDDNDDDGGEDDDRERRETIQFHKELKQFLTPIRDFLRKDPLGVKLEEAVNGISNFLNDAGRRFKNEIKDYIRSVCVAPRPLPPGRRP